MTMHVKRNVNELLRLIDNNPDTFDTLTNVPKFKDWLIKNMHIYSEFERYAIELKRFGRREKYSARAIIQRMRWDTNFSDSTIEYKIDNDCTPCMARLAMLSNASLTGMFRTKKKQQ